MSYFFIQVSANKVYSIVQPGSVSANNKFWTVEVTIRKTVIPRESAKTDNGTSSAVVLEEKPATCSNTFTNKAESVAHTITLT